MAVKTAWPVGHSCGHDEDHDLSEKRPSERAGYARWLAGRECSDCWRAKRDRQNAKDREKWQAERRAEETAAAQAWERSAEMPALEGGSDKAVEWGRRVRYQLVLAAHDHAFGIGVSDDDFAEQVETPARKITAASWWIDQRDAAGEDVAELVQDGATDLAETGNENPY
ncbi:hypothetical protein K6U06_05840 [Acidiferrimicrobium sp. IK]|uniref:hypothetical protein n=1 Tax=Acidiferrimicrobium sp. IK TaxID=2871700 RepID=UPI0021CB348A|nr:hypothetical protein [Acidiferrimicrobium sp. IK]MCU4183874.1 hypothetical protein [Acidiferrimicrobium sp. IK]